VIAVDTRPIMLLESASNSPVEAALHLALGVGQVRAAEAAWRPLRARIRAEHSHWDWDYKSGFLVEPGARCLGVECAGRMQGMMLVREVGHAARLDPECGRPLVYVDYLESAPWNLRAGGPHQYSGVGQVLVRAAVRRSLELGYRGRVELHSLPSSRFVLRAEVWVRWLRSRSELLWVGLLRVHRGPRDRIRRGMT